MFFWSCKEEGKVTGSDIYRNIIEICGWFAQEVRVSNSIYPEFTSNKPGGLKRRDTPHVFI